MLNSEGRANRNEMADNKALIDDGVAGDGDKITEELEVGIMKVPILWCAAGNTWASIEDWVDEGTNCGGEIGNAILVCASDVWRAFREGSTTGNKGRIFNGYLLTWTQNVSMTNYIRTKGTHL